MTDSFETQMDRIIVNTEAKLLAVVKDALDETINQSQEPQSEGGFMPVRTGFLRLSGQADINRIPVGPTRGEKNRSYVWSPSSLGVILSKLKLGDTFIWGWTAVYAQAQENRNKFLGRALMDWQANVDKAVNKLRGR